MLVLEYANYSSDMTRTIQSQENILRDKSSLQCRFKWKLQNACPGTLWKQYHIEVGKLMTSELLGLGLID
jgi:Xaa-Pro aminopeptidase